MSATDRFGDYGIIGFVTVDRRDFTVTNFFMSCRVQRKMLENAFFAALLVTAGRCGFDRLHVRHRATARNKPAVEVLQALGATPTEWPATPTEGEVIYEMLCSGPPTGSDIVALQDDVLGSWTQVPV